MSKDFPDLNQADFDGLSPIECETMARWIIRKLNESEAELSKYQEVFAQTESDLETEMARRRMHYSSLSRDNGKNYTVQQTEDSARLDCEILWSEYSKLKALVEIWKGRINVLKAQSDLVRSVMVSVREGQK